MIDRERVIKRLMRCVVPDRYSHYPKSFYERLTDDQLVSMCYEIKVDGPDFDIIDDENEGGSMGEYRNIADRILGHDVPIMELQTQDGFFSKLKKMFGAAK